MARIIMIKSDMPNQFIDIKIYYLQINKDENVHRFALSSVRGELLKRERERERKRV